MIISRLILKNWKNFLADVARPGGGLSFALKIRGGLDKIKFAPAKKKELVELEVHMADAPLSGTHYRYSLGIASDPIWIAQTGL